MAKRFVTILNDFQHHGVQYFKDEKVREEDATARYFCAAGWAKDESGEIKTAKPNAAEVRLDVKDGLHINGSPQVS